MLRLAQTLTNLLSLFLALNEVNGNMQYGEVAPN